MNDIELKEQLMKSARDRGICKPGYENMRSGMLEELVDYYLENPDWCLERSFPDFSMIRENFSSEEMEKKGIYVGRIFSGEVFDSRQAYIFHNCKGTIYVGMDYENAVIPMLYFANGCRMIVRCNQKENILSPIRVPLYTFGHNDIKAHDGRYARFTHYNNALVR